MSEPDAPRTTPECKRLENMVISFFRAGVFDREKRLEDALLALKRLRKKRCVLSLEYIIAYIGKGVNIFDKADAERIRAEARKHLDELS